VFERAGMLLADGPYRRDDPARLSADHVWIISPLDGTREFGERGRTDWAVHVTSRERGKLAGAVALLAQGTVLGAGGSERMPDCAPGPLRVAVSRTRPRDVVELVVDALGAELVPMGSAGVTATAVVLGEVDARIHGGVAVALQRARPAAADLVVCRPQLAAQILSGVRTAITGDA
jgi:3'(2'), 5'-bisphosphate nucleotidase